MAQNLWAGIPAPQTPDWGNSFLAGRERMFNEQRAARADQRDKNALIAQYAAAADTPEKWAQAMVELQGAGVPDARDFADKFQLRDTIIQRAYSASDQMNSRTAQGFLSSLGGGQQAPQGANLSSGYLSSIGQPQGAAPPVQRGPVGGAGMDVMGDAKLPPSLVRAESGGRQFGSDGRPLTSSAGAIGVAQVMPGTAPEAARMAGIPFDDNRYRNDPAYNEQLGAAYYDAMLKKYGDPALAAAAYNAGPGRVDQFLSEGRPLPAETVAYVQKVAGRALGATAGAGSVRPATRDVQAPTPNGVPLDSLQVLAGNPTYAGTAISAAINQYANPKDTTVWARSGDGWIFNQRTGEFQAAPGISDIKPTDDIREYEFAKQQGFAGSFQDWQLANRRAGATTVNTGDMSNPEALGDKKFAESMGTKQAESFNNIIDGGRMALQSVGDLNTLEQALQQVPTGGFEPLKAQVANYAASLGLDVQDAEQLGGSQAIGAIVARIAPRLRVPGSGTTSDRDLSLFLQSLPSLANSPEGNRIIIQTLRAFAQRGIQEAEIVNDGVALRRPRSQIQRDLQALGPVISTEQAKAMFAAPQGGQQGLPQFGEQWPQQGGDIPTVQTPEEAAKLPTGTRFRTPDGQIRVRN